MTEDKIVGWCYQLNGQELAQAPRDGEGQGSLVCCSPWGRKESDTTERLNNFMYLIKVKGGHRSGALIQQDPSPRVPRRKGNYTGRSEDGARMCSVLCRPGGEASPEAYLSAPIP